MKIHVDTPDGHHIHVPLPNCLLFNRTLLNIILKNIHTGKLPAMIRSGQISDCANQEAADMTDMPEFLTKEQRHFLVKRLTREFKSISHNFGHLTFVEVEAADGTYVKIQL